jgi:hypothetical protein
MTFKNDFPPKFVLLKKLNILNKIKNKKAGRNEQNRSPNKPNKIGPHQRKNRTHENNKAPNCI